MKPRHHLHAVVTTLLSMAIVLTTVCVTQLSNPLQAAAADAKQWDPGFIISDATFNDTSAMSVQDIATFLNSKGASCTGGSAPCLKNYTQTTTTVAADKYCKAYTGAANESAAQILWKVGQACGINPQVLIVTLQKETSLITATKPSSGAYQTAMGFGCPDSAACNTAYYGFFNQIYRAARQFQVYAANPNLFSFRAGVANTIAYNPKSSCGSSSVVIQNQATASLYNYTPYQPNAAALANLYGTGDSCSAYGNRNFWAYFTDWFGSPTLPWASGTLIDDESTNKVYLVNGGTLVYLDTYATSNALGIPSGVTMVTHASIASVPVDANVLRPVVTCGATTYAGVNGQLRALNTGVVGALPATTLATSTCAALPKGPALTGRLFATSPSTGRIYQIANGTRLYMTSLAQMRAFDPNAATTVWPDSELNLISDRYPSGTLIGDRQTNMVYLVNDQQLVYLDSYVTSQALGVPGGVPMADHATVIAYMSVASTMLRPVVSCGSTTYAGVNGQLRAISTANTGTLPTTALSTTTCQNLPKGTALTGALFATSSTTGRIYHITNGTKVYMGSWTQIYAIDPKPVIATWTDAMLDAVPTGLPSGILASDTTTGRVYFVTGGQLAYLDSYATVQSLGIPVTTTPTDHATIASMTATKDALRPVVTCGTATYAGVNGQARPVSTSKTGTLPSTAFDPVACLTLAKGAALTGQLFVSSPTTGRIYLVSDGVKVYMGSWTQIYAVDPKPVVATWPDSAINAIPDGILPGKLVADQTTQKVYFVNGSQLVYLDSYAASSALGVPAAVTSLSHATLSTQPVASASLRAVVTCGSTVYAGIGGRLRALSTAKVGTLPSTVLTDATCAVLPKGPALAGELFVASPTTGRIYLVASGKKTYMNSWTQIYSLDPAPVVATWPDSTIDAIPNS